jgi:hypothetical protein
MFVAQITELTGCTVDTSLRLWTRKLPDLGKAGVLTVIHFSTASFIHSCTAGDQPCLPKGSRGLCTGR